MKTRLLKNGKLWASLLTAIILYYLVHEGTHLVVALIYGVFENIRLVGIFGIQIVIADGSLNGVSLAIFSGLSIVVTLIVGYLLYFSTPRIVQWKNKVLIVPMYYATLIFMVLDSLYISVLTLFIGGGGALNGITTGLNAPDIPFRVVFGIISLVNTYLFIKKVSPQYREVFQDKQD